MTLISIVTPVYGNEASLADLLAKFQALAIQNPDEDFEFVFVNDSSPDDSQSVLERLAAQEARMRVFKLSRNFGSNAAILAGLSQARGQAVAAIAADLQDPPELIHEMLGLWRGGRKVVLAAREGRDDGWLLNTLSDIFYALFRRFAIAAMPERGFDFFLIDRQVCDLIVSIQENNIYLMGLILWLGFDPAVIPYQRKQREARYGVSMWTFARRIKYFIDAFVAFSYFPVRAASVMGLLLAFLGLLYAIVVVVARLLYAIPVSGWASMMVVLLAVSGTQLVMTGVIGEYVWRNLDETRRRPRFIIERRIEHVD